MGRKGANIAHLRATSGEVASAVAVAALREKGGQLGFEREPGLPFAFELGEGLIGARFMHQSTGALGFQVEEGLVGAAALGLDAGLRFSDPTVQAFGDALHAAEQLGRSRYRGPPNGKGEHVFDEIELHAQDARPQRGPARTNLPIGSVQQAKAMEAPPQHVVDKVLGDAQAGEELDVAAEVLLAVAIEEDLQREIDPVRLGGAPPPNAVGTREQVQSPRPPRRSGRGRRGSPPGRSQAARKPKKCRGPRDRSGRAAHCRRGSC